MHAAVDGDVRLVGKRTIGNWAVGALEMFFEGSWGHVCRTLFEGADADVACRQLGYGAGTDALRFGGLPDGDVADEGAVLSEAVLTTPGCDGDEPTLPDCRADADVSRCDRGGRRCGKVAPAVLLACVAAEEQGALPTLFLPSWHGRQRTTGASMAWNVKVPRGALPCLAPSIVASYAHCVDGVLSNTWPSCWCVRSLLLCQ